MAKNLSVNCEFCSAALQSGCRAGLQTFTTAPGGLEAASTAGLETGATILPSVIWITPRALPKRNTGLNSMM